MAFRQPFRSGLKDLAEGLMRQATIVRQQSEVEAQKELQLAQIESQRIMQAGQMWGATVEKVGNVAGEYFQNQAQQKANEQLALVEANRDTGKRILETARGEYERALSSYETLLRTANTPEQQNQLALLRGVLNDYRTLLATPDAADIPRLYDAIMSKQYGGVTDRPTPRERAIGRGDQPLVPGMRAMDIMTLSNVGASMAENAMKFQLQSAEDVQRLLREFNPSNPQSVWNAQAALANANSYPPELRELVLGPLFERMQQFQGDPEQMRLFTTTVAAQRAANDTTIINLEILEATKNALMESPVIANQLAKLQLNEAEINQIAEAYRTGIISGTWTPEQRRGLAVFAGVPESELDKWAQTRSAAYRTALQAEQRLKIAQANIAEQDFRIGGQTYKLNEFRIDEAQWQKDRRRILAQREDMVAEETLLRNIGSAAANDDVELLDMYLNAYYNPSSLVGQQLRVLFNEEEGGERQLWSLYSGARERAGYRNEILANDAALSAIRREDAMWDLMQNRALTPYQIEALRAQYQLDLARAIEDLQRVPLRALGEDLQAWTTIARAAPVSLWDQVAQDPRLMARMRASGMSLDHLRNIGLSEEWSLQDPVRREAWNRFNVLLKTSPVNEIAKDSMLQAAYQMFDDMNMTPLERAGMVNALLSVWAANKDELDAARRGMATSVEDMTLSELSTMQLLWSRVADGFLDQRRVFVIEQISGSGCADVVSTTLTAPQIKRTQGRDVASSFGGTTCGELFDKWDRIVQEHENAVEALKFWSDAAQDRFGPSGRFVPELQFQPPAPGQPQINPNYTGGSQPPIDLGGGQSTPAAPAATGQTGPTLPFVDQPTARERAAGRGAQPLPFGLSPSSQYPELDADGVSSHPDAKWNWRQTQMSEEQWVEKTKEAGRAHQVNPQERQGLEHLVDLIEQANWTAFDSLYKEFEKAYNKYYLDGILEQLLDERRGGARR